ncbi:hypothetical protein MRX96_044489 [Rhipicephalus microplus]
MPLFPGHRYLGPGNPLQNGEPVDQDDRIAKRHDEAYSRAKSDADVFAADRQSTKECFKDFVSTGNWHSALGAAGLGTKNLVEEKVLGRSLYGMPPGRKRGNQEQPSTSAKRQQYDDTTDGEEMPQTEAAADAPSSSRGAGVGSNHPNTSECVQQILRVPRDHGVVTVFNDSKILTTWGYAMLKTSLKYDGEKTFPGIVTRMSRLPVDRPYLYIPHGTFLNIPAHTKALECSAKITPHGLRTPWKTGSSVVQPVNSDMLVYGISSIGLNHCMDTGMCRITHGTTHNAMKPQTIVPFSLDHHADLAKSYWGLEIHPITEVQEYDDKTGASASMGAPRHNFAYDFIHIDGISPRLTKFVNQYPFKGQVVLQVQLVPPAPIIDEPCFRHQLDLGTTFKPFLDKQASSTWSTLDTDYLKDGHRTPAFSGHEGAADMCSSLTKPLLFVVQWWVAKHDTYRFSARTIGPGK